MASLHGLTGQPTQSVPTFRLPGLATGALFLDATLTTPGIGRVTVTVTAQSNAAITAADMAMVRTANQAPVT